MRYGLQDLVDGKIVVQFKDSEWPMICDALTASGITDASRNPLNRAKRPCYSAGGVWVKDKLLIGWFSKPLPRVQFSDLLLYAPADFFAGRVGVRCETREEYDALMRELASKRMRWWDGSPLYTNPDRIPIRVANNAVFDAGHGIYTRSADEDFNDNIPCVPFSTVFPSDPWAEFVAGKCYLRVTKAEWAEFARRCDKSALRWHSGLKASERRSEYVDRGVALMGLYAPKGNRLDSWLDNGRTDRPIYDFSALLPAKPALEPKPAPTPAPVPQPYDGRGKHKVGDLFKVIDSGNGQFHYDDVLRFDHSEAYPEFGHFTRISDGSCGVCCWSRLRAYAFPRIEITTDGRVTTATLYEGEKAVKTATATCGPDDAFDFEKGARLAFDRLVGKYTDSISIGVECDMSAVHADIAKVTDAMSALAKKFSVFGM